MSTILSFVAVVVLSFVVVTLIASFLRYYMLTQRVQDADENDLAPKDRFYMQVVRELGALHQTPAPFSVLLVDPRMTGEFNGTEGTVAADTYREELESVIRQGLRCQDFVSAYENGLVAVLGRFAFPQVEAITQRLSEHIARSPVLIPGGNPVRSAVTIGAACYPVHGSTASELIEQARHALDQALTKGRGQIHCLPVEQSSSEKEADTATTQGDGTKKKDTRQQLDPLTGVLRHERFGTALRKVVAQQRMEGGAVCVLCVSIDHFQQYVDHYRQEGADHLLKEVADLLADRTRETDLLARTGESDFALALDCAPTDGLKAAQRVVSAIQNHPFRIGDATVGITASAGVAGHPDHTGQARVMLSLAQIAMRAARSRGRDLALLFEPDMQQESGPVNERSVDAL